MKKGQRQLGDLQLAIMRVLWRQGEATVSQVHQLLLAERGLAPTTIATMLAKMEKKGVVEHRTEGRRFVYNPRVTEAEITSSMVDQLSHRLFGGDVKALMSFLISDSEIERDELGELKRLIEMREREES